MKSLYIKRKIFPINYYHDLYNAILKHNLAKVKKYSDEYDLSTFLHMSNGVDEYGIALLTQCGLGILHFENDIDFGFALLKIFLLHGYDINSVKNGRNGSLLSFIIRSYDREDYTEETIRKTDEVFRYCIDVGADINVKDLFWDSPKAVLMHPENQFGCGDAKDVFPHSKELLAYAKAAKKERRKHLTERLAVLKERLNQIDYNALNAEDKEQYDNLSKAMAKYVKGDIVSHVPAEKKSEREEKVTEAEDKSLAVYNEALTLKENGNYNEAKIKFASLNDYKDSKNQINEINNLINEKIYNEALKQIEDKEYEKAIVTLSKVKGYKDADSIRDRISKEYNEEIYNKALSLWNNKEIDKATELFRKINNYKDSFSFLNGAFVEKRYIKICELIDEKSYQSAYDLLRTFPEYKDSEKLFEKVSDFLNEEKYNIALNKYNHKDYLSAKQDFEKIRNYKDSARYIDEIEKTEQRKKLDELKVIDYEKATIAQLVQYQNDVNTITHYPEEKKELEDKIEYELKIHTALAFADRNINDYSKYEKIKETLIPFASDERTKEYFSKCEETEAIYQKSHTDTKTNVRELKKAVSNLKTISSYKDSVVLISNYEKRIASQKKKEKMAIIIAIASVAFIIIILISMLFIIRNSKCNKAKNALKDGDFDIALELVDNINNKEANKIVTAANAGKALEEGDYALGTKYIITDLKGYIIINVTDNVSSKIRTSSYKKVFSSYEPIKIDGYTLSDYKLTNISVEEEINGVCYHAVMDFTANYSPINYKINYNLNGGTNSSDNPDSFTLLDSEIILNPASKNGYTFDYWLRSDTNLKAEKITIDKNSYKDITLTAIYTPIEYTLTTIIHYENAEDETSSSSYNCDDNPYISVVKPTLKGYEFDGWYYNNKLLSSKLASNQICDDITLYGYAKIKNYSINYYLDGGTNNSDNKSAFTLFDYPELKDPSKEGYSFEGWYTSEDYTEKIETLEGKEDDINLYAKFSPATSSIHLNADGGTMNINYPITITYMDGDDVLSSDTISYNQSYTIPYTTKNGYCFIGWYNDKECTDRQSFAAPFTKDTVLYAKFQKSDYTYDTSETTQSLHADQDDTIMKFTSKGNYAAAVAFKDGPVSITVTNTSYSSAVSTLQKYYVADVTITVNGKNASSYSTISSTTCSYNATAGDYILISFIGERNTFDIDGTVTFEGTLYDSLKFQDISEMTVDAVYDSSVTLETPTKTGYTFVGWKDEEGNIYSTTFISKFADETYLTAVWEANS